MVTITTSDIETIEATNKSHRADETMKHKNPEQETEFSSEEEENEFYLRILHQMCVAA